MWTSNLFYRKFGTSQEGIYLLGIRFLKYLPLTEEIVMTTSLPRRQKADPSITLEGTSYSNYSAPLKYFHQCSMQFEL